MELFLLPGLSVNHGPPSAWRWDMLKNPSSEISDWEHKTGIDLPKGYRDFILRFNGVKPYPNILNLDSMPENLYLDGSTYLSFIYRWQAVQAEWEGEGSFPSRLPPDMLNIACDPGSLEFLMSVSKDTFGQIFAWFHSIEEWRVGVNQKIYPIANSFHDLLRRLYDNDEKEGHDFWYRSSQEHLIRRVEI